MIVGIAGYGKVGQGVGSIIRPSYIYDPPKVYNREKLDGDFLFICVPTPAKADGSCDTSIVEEILKKSEATINIVRSTVWIGFTDWVVKTYRKRVVFMPEYGPSEFPNHPFNDVRKIPWAILGGHPRDTKEVGDLWQQYLYNIKVFQTDSTTAELVKLAENAYFYSKLTFFNQIYDIAREHNLDYDEVRLLLTEDPRIEADHSFIHPNKRKIGGPCLPKDLGNLITSVKVIDMDFLKLMRELNEKRT